jgi:hypothetical protein
LPLYPEQRQCRRPTTEQVLRLFSLAQRHRLLHEGQTVQTFGKRPVPASCVSRRSSVTAGRSRALRRRVTAPAGS